MPLDLPKHTTLKNATKMRASLQEQEFALAQT